MEPVNTDLHRGLVDGSLYATDTETRNSSISRRKFLLAAGTGAAALSIPSGASIWYGLASDFESECDKGTVIEPPLHGEWIVMNPPGHSALAHDFIGMREGHRLPYPASAVPRHLLYKMPVSCAYGWGRPVYAPIEGTVLEVGADEPDRDRVNLFSDALDTLVSPPSIEDGDIRPAAGNYVIIESPEGIAFLAHLRQGSVAVTEEMDVVPGQFLGKIGNSGASLFPHLHLQFMSEWTPDVSKIDNILLPYRISSYERRTGSWYEGYSWTLRHNCAPGQRERIRISPQDDSTIGGSPS